MTDVVELQRLKILNLEKRNSDLVQELCKQIDVNADLSRVLSYLTEGRFREFVKGYDWNSCIGDYLMEEH